MFLLAIVLCLPHQLTIFCASSWLSFFDSKSNLFSRSNRESVAHRLPFKDEDESWHHLSTDAKQDLIELSFQKELKLTASEGRGSTKAAKKDGNQSSPQQINDSSSSSPSPLWIYHPYLDNVSSENDDEENLFSLIDLIKTIPDLKSANQEHLAMLTIDKLLSCVDLYIVPPYDNLLDDLFVYAEDYDRNLNENIEGGKRLKENIPPELFCDIVDDKELIATMSERPPSFDELVKYDDNKIEGSNDDGFDDNLHSLTRNNHEIDYALLLNQVLETDSFDAYFTYRFHVYLIGSYRFMGPSSTKLEDNKNTFSLSSA